MIFTNRLKGLIGTFFKSKKRADIEMRCGSVERPGDQILTLQKSVLNVLARQKTGTGNQVRWVAFAFAVGQSRERATHL